MSESIITRRGSGGYAKVTFDVPCTKLNKVYNVSMLSVERDHLASTTLGDYALFGGGYSHSSVDTVEVYNKNLTRSTITSLSHIRCELDATTVGNYALFGGGWDDSYRSNVVDAYDSNLVRSTALSLNIEASLLSATTVGNYAIFAGGYLDLGYDSDVTTAYNTNLTRLSPASLYLDAREKLSSTSVGNYALFGGGYCLQNNRGSKQVDAYDSNLTHNFSHSLIMGRWSLSATTLGNYALFGCGRFAYGASPYCGNMESFDNNLTRSEVSSGAVYEEYAATTLGDYALFAGGVYATSGQLPERENYTGVDVYDKNTVLHYNFAPDIGLGRERLSASTIGKYALFAGGRIGADNAKNYVDAFTFETKKIQIYPMSKYKFNDMSSETTSQTLQEIELTTPITGYIKVKNTTVN